jgi:hypothetical protein
MATKAKHIIPVMGFRRMADADLISRATTIETQMTGNANYPTPPVDLNTLKTTITSFSAAVAAALDGGKKQTADKNKLKDQLVKMLRQLATYVEATAGEDEAIFTSSGFEAKAPKTPAQPLTQPVVSKIDYGTTGQMTVRLAPIRKAKLYELRYAAMANGAAGAWTTVQLLSSKPYQLNGLTPGTIYAFQVRALNNAGYTNWSDSFTKMAV